jgi:Leucine-rich repeat (LRR) protein
VGVGDRGAGKEDEEEDDDPYLYSGTYDEEEDDDYKNDSDHESDGVLSRPATPDVANEIRKKSGEVATDFVSKLMVPGLMVDTASATRLTRSISMPVKISPVDAEADRAAAVKVKAGDERGALTQLFRSTRGASWRQSDNWCTDEPLCDWFGVTLDDDGHVKDLDLGENNLRGKIPTSLGVCTRITGLYLDTNYLRGDIPETIRGCSMLRDFYANNNQLAGGIPEAMCDLRALEVLNVESNHLTGDLPKSIGQLDKLVCLDLRWNHMTGPIPVSIASCVKLEEIWLQGNEFSGKIPQCISTLPALEWLGLSNNRFEDLCSARSMFRGRFGSRVGIFLDGSGDQGGPKRKSSAPASLMLDREEWNMTEKEMHQVCVVVLVVEVVVW